MFLKEPSLYCNYSLKEFATGAHAFSQSMSVPLYRQSVYEIPIFICLNGISQSTINRPLRLPPRSLVTNEDIFVSECQQSCWPRAVGPCSELVHDERTNHVSSAMYSHMIS